MKYAIRVAAILLPLALIGCGLSEDQGRIYIAGSSSITIIDEDVTIELLDEGASNPAVTGQASLATQRGGDPLFTYTMT